MHDSSWKRPLSWVALILVLLGFILSLGIYLAAWGGINADVSAPWLVQVIRVGAYGGVILVILGNLYLVWNKRWRAAYSRLPLWPRRVMPWGVLLLFGYWLVYSAATFSLFPGTDDAVATMHLRDESCRWVLVYGMFLQLMIQFSWGWHWFRSQSVPSFSAPR